MGLVNRTQVGASLTLRCNTKTFGVSCNAGILPAPPSRRDGGETSSDLVLGPDGGWQKSPVGTARE